MSAGSPEDSVVHTHQTPFAVAYGNLYQRYQSSFVTIEQCADELNIHFQTARAWLSGNRFPVPTQTLGSRRVVSIAALADFIIRGVALQGTDTADTNKPSPLLPAVEADSEPAAEQEQPPQKKRKPGRPRKSDAASGKAVRHGC